jgi:CRISPR system Cascade subunit CasB
MSDYAESFMTYLQSLAERDRAAMAHLRRSLSFEAGADPKVYPYVERFVARESHASDSHRLALYLTAGLFSVHPSQGSSSFATAYGDMFRQRESDSIEKRFIALLGADADNIANYLRQAVSLLKADAIAFNYVKLLRDLSQWLNPNLLTERRDSLRQQWARDFYRAIAVSVDDQKNIKSTEENIQLPN